MKKKKNLIIKCGFLSIAIILLVISIFIINTKLLMSNSVYDTINIKEQEKYTIQDNYISVCTSSNDSIVKARIVSGKCVLTGMSKGQTDVELFLADKGINEISYNVIVNSNVKINKRFRIRFHSLLFHIDTINISNIDFEYCLISNNNKCHQESINNNKNIVQTNKNIKFNNLNNSIKKVCLYAYDDNKKVDSLCVDRGLFNLFW